MIDRHNVRLNIWIILWLEGLVNGPAIQNTVYMVFAPYVVKPQMNTNVCVSLAPVNHGHLCAQIISGPFVRSYCNVDCTLVLVYLLLKFKVVARTVVVRGTAKHACS